MRLDGKEASYKVAEVNLETRPTFLLVFGLSWANQKQVGSIMSL
jgi:hypothetical protein